jgi:hypothetical protein
VPKSPDEEQWQYMSRMVELARRMLDHVREQKRDRHHVWFFGNLASILKVPKEDIAVACRTLVFTGECHVRDGCFFLKSAEERDDDLRWQLGIGPYAQ